MTYNGVFEQRLEAEGDSGLLFIYATFTDETPTQDITHVESFEFSSPEDVITASVSESNGQYVVTVDPGADSIVGKWLNVKLLDLEGNVISTGSPVANITLPAAEGISTSNNCASKISRAGDRATDIFNRRTTCQLSVTLEFPGKEKHTAFWKLLFLCIWKSLFLTLQH